MRLPKTRLLLACLVMAGSTIGLTGVAAADTVSSTSATITSGTVFTPWGDTRNYEPLPAGTGETALRSVGGHLEGWQFTNAGFTSGETPWDVWGTTNSSVVRLAGTGSAAHLTTWSDHVEDVRFFYKAPQKNAFLLARVHSYDRASGRQEWVDHQIFAPAAGWNVSPALTIDTKGRTGTWDIQVSFWSFGGTFLIDDVSIDPWVSKPR